MALADGFGQGLQKALDDGFRQGLLRPIYREDFPKISVDNRVFLEIT